MAIIYLADGAPLTYPNGFLFIIPLLTALVTYGHLVHILPVSGPVLVQLHGLVELPLGDDPRGLEVVVAARTDGVAGLVEDVLDHVGELGARVGGDVALLVLVQAERAGQVRADVAEIGRGKGRHERSL